MWMIFRGIEVVLEVVCEVFVRCLWVVSRNCFLLVVSGDTILLSHRVALLCELCTAIIPPPPPPTTTTATHHIVLKMSIEFAKYLIVKLEALSASIMRW